MRAAAPVVGILVAALLVWQGSYAAFSATTADNTNAWSSGSITSLTNNGGGASFSATTTALFNQANLRPGDAGVKCLTVQSTATTAGVLKLYRSALTDSAPSLGAQIRLTVDAQPGFFGVQSNCFGVAGAWTNVLSNVALTGLPTSFVTAATSMPVAAGTQYVVYRFTWTFASTGTNAGDSALMGKTVSAGFTWEMQ